MTTITAKAMKHLLNARSAIMGISLFGLFFADVFGQASISGSIEEENGNPLPFANVLLLNAQDSTLVKGMVTCEKGIYSTENIIPGEYMINASMVGYQSACLPPFQLAANSGQIHLSRLVLKEDVSELSEVVIKGQKPLYEMQMDRLVINVQNSITSAGSSVLEVLRKSPGVMVDEQNNTISMYGKSGVVVMINEKISRLPVDAMVQMMKGMSAANIERIELITQPPSKYVAEVNGAKLYYEIAGEGQPLVFLSGGSSDHRIWDDQFMQLSKRFRVLRYDNRCIGKSIISDYDVVFSDYEDVKDLLDHLGIEKAHICGYNTAVDFAIAFPDKCLSLIAIGPWVYGYRSPAHQSYPIDQTLY
jgi:hypothetical protein